MFAYGAAKFNPSSKNELSATTTYVSKRCGKQFPTLFVDEYNTTKVCHCCDEIRTGDQVRGLRWCCSTKFRTSVYPLYILCFDTPVSIAKPSGLAPNLGFVL